MKNIKTWQDVLLEITETDPADFSDRSNICISQKDLGDILRAAMDGQEVHAALCPALTGGKCTCSVGPATVDKAWSQFCGGIGRGPDAPYPGMIEAFEAHYGQSFTDKDWRNEASTWAAAWGYATRQASSEDLQSQQDKEIGKKWREDSRLEEWFPLTHEEHLRLQVEVARLRPVASCQVKFHTEGASHEKTNSTR